MSLGAHGIRRPSTPAISDSHAERIRTVELNRPLDSRPDRAQFDVPFSYPNTLSASVSPRYYPRHSGRLTAVAFSLDTAGSTATTFKVYRNGSVLTPLSVDSNMTIVTSTTLSLTATNHYGLAQFDHLFSKDTDYLQIEIVSVGTAAKDLTAHARFG